MLVTKGFEFFDIISSDRKDTQTLEHKKWAWDQIAASVNKVNISGSIRTGKDASGKWQQLKCKAGGKLEVLKQQFELLDER